MGNVIAYIIILTGIPASGKTTFSKYLSKDLGVPVISKDFIKEILFDDIGFKSREEKVKLGIASMNIMYGIAEESMKLNKTVILENNFENISKKRLNMLIKTYNYEVINIRFQGEISVIYNRFVKRNHSKSRHLGHVINESYPPKGPVHNNSIITLKEFEEMIISRGILDFDIGGEVINVDTTDFSKVNYKEIINKVKDRIR
ncbi:ATP-binding protein [Clostridium sp. SHJSY1]|uniref:AAA family ATPase n=1 Tax=Clostridium sp. SHJSY1 TaxID=2942483 RepID=UPI0028751C65|nr:AAA family ATPase [Clostridium sp. SHJSY1]MDS0526719.1 ATP-binding protein [Clostridium sp. SHJSY1]